MERDVTLQHVFQWSEKNVVEWLRERGLDRYESEFIKHQIDGVALLELNYNLLKELNVRTVGERVKLNAAISQLRTKCLFNKPKVLGSEPANTTDPHRSPAAYSNGNNNGGNGASNINNSNANPMPSHYRAGPSATPNPGGKAAKILGNTPPPIGPLTSPSDSYFSQKPHHHHHHHNHSHGSNGSQQQHQHQQQQQQQQQPHKGIAHPPASAPLSGPVLSAQQLDSPIQLDLKSANKDGRKRSNIWAHKIEEKTSGPSSLQRSSSGPPTNLNSSVEANPSNSPNSSTSPNKALANMTQTERTNYLALAKLSEQQYKRQSNRFSKRGGYVQNGSGAWGVLENEFRGLFDTDDGISKLADSLSVDRRQVIVIGGNGETRRVDVTSAKTSRGILDAILREFGLMSDIDKDKYALFVMSGEGGGARSLSDEELISICCSPQRSAKERLFLRKRHLVNRTIDSVQRSVRLQRTIEKLETIIPASTSSAVTPPPPNSAPLQVKGNGNINKLAHFFGERPPAEQVSENLKKYFPGNEVRVRHSIMRNSRQFDFSEIPYPMPKIPEHPKLRTSTSLSSIRDSDGDTSDSYISTELESEDEGGYVGENGHPIPDGVVSDGDVIVEESESELERLNNSIAAININGDDTLDIGTVSTATVLKRTPSVSTMTPTIKGEAPSSTSLEKTLHISSSPVDAVTQALSETIASATTVASSSAAAIKGANEGSATTPKSSTGDSKSQQLAESSVEDTSKSAGPSIASPISSCVAELSTLVEAPTKVELPSDRIAAEVAAATSLKSKRQSRRSVASKRHSSGKRGSTRSSMNFGGLSGMMMPGMRVSAMKGKKGSWIKGAPIASGSFGSVFYGVHTRKGVIMAVKEVDLPIPGSVTEARKKRMLSALQRELTLLQDIRHKNIVQYLGTEMDNEHLYIFLEYVAGGSVASLLSSFGAFPETLVRSYVRQTLEGLEYLHASNIIHCDIKGGNVLVDPLGNVKISDFGISKKVDEVVAQTSNHRLSLQGSVFWMAPEVVKDTKYTVKGDIWSLGCLIIEMLTAKHPFHKFDQLQALLMIGKRQQPEMPSNVTKECRELLEKALALDYEERPTASELLKFSFVSELNLPTTA